MKVIYDTTEFTGNRAVVALGMFDGVHIGHQELIRNAVTLAKDADLVISECGALPGDAKVAGPHMDPATCAKLAVEANVKQMVLTHFGAAAYTSIAFRMNAVNEARSVFPNLITGVDNMEIVL